MRNKAYFYIPKRKFKSHKGSAPYLAEMLVKELEGATEIKISFFLYNNPYLHSQLEKLMEKGCKITVFTIPLDGYDTKSTKVYYRGSENHIFTSKREYSSRIFDRINILGSNFKLFIFPHTYIWFKQKFSRGKHLYSLHNKSILAKFGNNGIKCISSSCNFALGDPPHSENLLIISNETSTADMFKTYFNLLRGNSLSIEEYIEFRRGNMDIQHIVEPVDLNDNFNTCYFTAPFIKYNAIGSNHYVQNKIIEFIQTAQRRIYICSQHFSDYNSFDKQSKSIVDAIRQVKRIREIELKIIKQTQENDQRQGKRTSEVERILANMNLTEQRVWRQVIHDKFIIVDNSVMVSTANFTSTQFAWSEEHLMKYMIDDNNEHKVINTFSEVNSFHFIYESVLVRDFMKHFRELWKLSNGI